MHGEKKEKKKVLDWNHFFLSLGIFRALIALLCAWLPVLKDGFNIKQWERSLRSFPGVSPPTRGVTPILGPYISYTTALVLRWMPSQCEHWFLGLDFVCFLSIQMCLVVSILSLTCFFFFLLGYLKALHWQMARITTWHNQKYVNVNDVCSVCTLNSPVGHISKANHVKEDKYQLC